MWPAKASCTLHSRQLDKHSRHIELQVVGYRKWKSEQSEQGATESGKVSKGVPKMNKVIKSVGNNGGNFVKQT